MPSTVSINRPLYRFIVAGNFRDGQYHQAKAIAEQILTNYTPLPDDKKPDGEAEVMVECFPLTPFDWDNDTYWVKRWPDSKRKQLLDRTAKAIVLVEQWTTAPLWYERRKFLFSNDKQSSNNPTGPVDASLVPVEHPNEQQQLWIGDVTEFAEYSVKSFKVAVKGTTEEFRETAARQWSDWLKQHQTMRSVVGLQVSIDGKLAGELLVQVYTDVCPQTARNFIELAKGVQTSKDGKSLSYKDSRFHRLVRDGFVQGGDIDAKSGKGGQSIYGKHFADESFKLTHHRGTVSMANSGPHTNGSQFFICMKRLPTFDGNFVAFGRLIDGDGVLNAMNSVQTTYPERPVPPITITQCSIVQHE